MALGADAWALRDAADATCARAGLEVVDSYVSMTEVSEYAAGMPDELLQARLLPDAAARRAARVLLLPDVQAPRRRGTTGTSSTTRAARS